MRYHGYKGERAGASDDALGEAVYLAAQARARDDTGRTWSFPQPVRVLLEQVRFDSGDPHKDRLESPLKRWRRPAVPAATSPPGPLSICRWRGGEARTGAA